MNPAQALPLVSVCCITYNHEAYLAQAIESVLMQETAFAVEMVIGEDCSTDRTRQIALDYQARFPNRVRVRPAAPNQGIMPNLIATLTACTGRYIALLDGDDYWTDPRKLQRQVEVLEAQPGCALCVHDAEVFTQDDSVPPFRFSTKCVLLPVDGGAITQAVLVRYGWTVATASMLFRSTSLLPAPDWLRGVYGGDYALQLLCTCHGYAYYIPEVMSRYRLHVGGISHPTNDLLQRTQKMIYQTLQFKRLLPHQPQAGFNQALVKFYLQGSYMHMRLGNLQKQWVYLWKALNVDHRHLPQNLLRLAKRRLRFGA